MIIFAEGSTSNNTHLLKFKRGAFETLRSVQPVVMMYDSPVVHPGNQVFSDYWAIILMMCTLKFTRVNTMILPTFTPNDYLFEHHGDGVKPKWEIYADAVRDVMCQESGLKKSDQTYRELNSYWKYLTGQ